MTYSVKSIFYTLQGEGARAGRPAVFLRFSGCNLWTGREKDRLTAICQFCDTDFVGTDGPGGGKFAESEELAAAVARRWPVDATGNARPYVVCTGGEPLLQLDSELVTQLQRHGFEVAVETNGTLPAPVEIDWITVSPKADAELLQGEGSELKLIYPQVGDLADPALYENMNFEHHFLQPMDSPHQDRNTQACLEYCLRNPRWRMAIQMHKIVGIP